MNPAAGGGVGGVGVFNAKGATIGSLMNSSGVRTITGGTGGTGGPGGTGAVGGSGAARALRIQVCSPRSATREMIKGGLGGPGGSSSAGASAEPAARGGASAAFTTKAVDDRRSLMNLSAQE